MSALSPPSVITIPSPVSPSRTASGTNVAAVVTLPGASSSRNVISGVAFSYGGSGTLAGGNLTIAAAGVTVMSLDIAEKNVYTLELPMIFAEGEAVTFTMAAGGSNVIGSITVLGFRVESSTDRNYLSLDFANFANSMYVPLLF